MLEQIVQLIGAFLVLGGFAGLQLGKFDVRSVRYLLLNAVGSGLLAIVAIHDREWGFILLESVWSMVALLGLMRVVTNRRLAN
jgi:hypothetical protein